MLQLVDAALDQVALPIERLVERQRRFPGWLGRDHGDCSLRSNGIADVGRVGNNNLGSKSVQEFVGLRDIVCLPGRHAKQTARNFLAMIAVVAITLWLR